MGEMKAEFTLKRDVYMMEVLEFGSDIKMIFVILGLPQIPGSDEAFASRLEMFFDLV